MTEKILRQTRLIPIKQLPLRLWYMFCEEVCTIIDVDESRELLQIHNFTDKLQFRAFGVIEHPTFSDYEEFFIVTCN